MRLTLTGHTDRVTHLDCEGDVTQHEFKSDQDPLETVMGANIYRHCVLLSLDKTTYIDSSGISWLLHGHKEFERLGGRLVLHSVSPMVKQVLQLLKLNTILHVAADEGEALQLAQGAKA